MKRVVALFVALALVAVASSANAADRGISKAGLKAMGLPGLTVMSDAEGRNVRGMGAIAFSVSGTYAFSFTSGAANLSGAAANGNFVAGAASTSSSGAGTTGIFGIPIHSAGASASGGAIAGGF